VDITPAPGFVGTATFQVAPRGDGADPVTITVEVVPEPAPDAVDDQIEVERGAIVVIDAATLLGNDRPSPAPAVLSLRAADPLRLVSVYGFDGGTAVLRLDGQIEVQADEEGSFTYTVTDAWGATGSARVLVQLASEAPTTPAPTAPPTVPTDTAPPVTVLPTSPAINVPTTRPTGQGAGTPTTPIGRTLPQTGADPTQRVRLAMTMLLLGGLLVLVVRRRTPTSRQG
jgi:LPXTG-motif cell wall-anchored protein